MTIAIPDHVFRGYDLRGIVGSELNKDTVGLLAKGYATWLLQRRIYDCVVGYDCRLSSPQFRDILVGVLLKSGITVYDIGLTLTQIAYFAQYVYKTRGMVMITASHNPKEYNGFKFGTGYSETMLTDEIIYLDDKPHTVSVDSEGLFETIKNLYKVDRLAYELRNGKMK